MPRGARPGERRGGRAKGTPNKATAEIREVAKGYGPAAIRRAAELAGLISGTPAAQSEQAQMAAINTILDRAYGKAAQPIGGGDGTEPIKHLFGWLPSDG